MATTRLRRYRVAIDMTMEDLALRAAISYSRLSQLERGKALPSMQTAERLATVLGVEVSDLYPSEELKSLGGRA